MRNQDNFQILLILVIVFALYKFFTTKKSKLQSNYYGSGFPCNGGYQNRGFDRNSSTGIYSNPKNYLQTPAVYGRWRCNDLVNDCDCFLDGGSYKPCYNTGGVWTY